VDSDEEGTMYGIVEGISSEERNNSSDKSVGVGTLLSLISRNFIFSFSPNTVKLPRNTHGHKVSRVTNKLVQNLVIAQTKHLFVIGLTHFVHQKSP
jgi:hypothetical protein